MTPKTPEIFADIYSGGKTMFGQTKEERGKQT